MSATGSGRPFKLFSLALALSAFMGLAACQNSPPVPTRFPDITFSEYPPIRLDVAHIEVVDQYRQSDQPPHVEEDFPVNIARTAERWAHDRLRAAGAQGTARVTIKDASVVAQPLPQTGGVKGLFTNDQAVRYVARVDVVVEILTDHGFSRALVEATAQRSRSVPEDITLNKRDGVFFDLTEALMTDLNASLDKNIHAFMARYIL